VAAAPGSGFVLSPLGIRTESVHRGAVVAVARGGMGPRGVAW